MQNYKTRFLFFILVFSLSLKLGAQTIVPPAAPTITQPAVTPPKPPSPPNFETAAKNSAKTKAAEKSAKTEKTTAAGLQMLSSLLGMGDSAGGINPSTLSNLGKFSGGLGSIGLQKGQAGEADILLNQVIEKLDKILSSLETKKAPDTVFKIPVASKGQVLRFTANSGTYNILNTCSAVFISDPEPDGTFLFTGDRVYTSGEGKGTQVLGETFYMLFKPIKNGGFEVALNVRQNIENKTSILYQLSQQSPLYASRTGNLVSLHPESPAPKIDLLLNIAFIKIE